MTVELGALIMTGVGVSGTVLLGVWGMLAHYETRNDRAHADLGRRIDGMNGRMDAMNGRIDEARAELGKRIDGVNGRIDEVRAELGKRIDGVNGRDGRHERAHRRSARGAGQAPRRHGRSD